MRISTILSTLFFHKLSELKSKIHKIPVPPLFYYTLRLQSTNRTLGSPNLHYLHPKRSKTLFPQGSMPYGNWYSSHGPELWNDSKQGVTLLCEHLGDIRHHLSHLSQIQVLLISLSTKGTYLKHNIFENCSQVTAVLKCCYQFVGTWLENKYWTWLVSESLYGS